MRIWDIHPGYLNRQSLLSEHRELHGLVSIMVNGKQGYSHHPETLRWLGYGWALRQRHRQLVAEMSLRGYKDNTPVLTRARKGEWPQGYIDEPYRQLHILASKYQGREQGRIPLPTNAQQLWSQHKYSVLARDVNLYQALGKEVSAMKPQHDFSILVERLAEQLRIPPSPGGLRNALQHMWGYVADSSAGQNGDIASWSLKRLAQEIQRRALSEKMSYLLMSTALSDLQAWMPRP